MLSLFSCVRHLLQNYVTSALFSSPPPKNMKQIQLAAICLAILSYLMTQVSCDTFDKICDKNLGDAMTNVARDGAGRCCDQWLVAFCTLESIPEIVRGATSAATRLAFEAGECSKYASNISGSMPIACYWDFRKWAVIMIGAVAIMAIIIPTLVVFAVRRRKRQATMRMF